NTTLVHLGASPELARHLDRVDAGSLPPRSLIAGPVKRAVMGTAQGNSKFVTSLAAKRPRLHVPQVMRVRRFAAADEAGLLSDVTQMIPIPVSARRSNREDALVDAGGLINSCSK